MSPTEPKPFCPYRADQTKEPKENLLGLIEWVTEALWRNHQIAASNFRYTQLMYERMFGISQRPGVAGVARPGARPFIQDRFLYDVGRTVVANRKHILEFLKGFFPGK